MQESPPFSGCTANGTSTGADSPSVWYAARVDDRLLQGRRAWGLGLAVNGVLALVKLTAGIVGNSYALVADAVESLGDVVSSVVVWGGLAIGSRPADHDHPYGHGKAEPLAAFVVALLLLAAAVGIAIRALHHVVEPHEAPAAFTLVVLFAVIAVKEAMYRFELRVGQRIDSTVIVVDAWHHRSDALTSAAAAIGITIALIGGEGYERADDLAALAACVVIIVNGARFARSAVAELMDTTPDTDLFDSVQEATLQVEGAHRVEKVLVRKMGPRLYIDLHLEVDAGLTVRKAHGIAHEVKDSIMSRWPSVADVLVHVEPHSQDE